MGPAAVMSRAAAGADGVDAVSTFGLRPRVWRPAAFRELPHLGPEMFPQPRFPHLSALLPVLPLATDGDAAAVYGGAGAVRPVMMADREAGPAPGRSRESDSAGSRLMPRFPRKRGLTDHRK